MQAYDECWGGSEISQHIASASSIKPFKLASDENKEKRHVLSQSTTAPLKLTMKRKDRLRANNCDIFS